MLYTCLNKRLSNSKKARKKKLIAPAKIKPSTSSIFSTASTTADALDHYTTRPYTYLSGMVNILPQMLDLNKLANMGQYKH